MRQLDLYLLVTNECSKNCDHCYAKNEEKKMTGQVASDLAKWISREDFKQLSLTIAGGEPTTNIDVVFGFYDLVREYKPLCHFFTNGDFLNDDILQELKQRNMGVKFNPTYRSLIEIESWISKIKNICGKVTLAVVANEINLPRLPELTELVLKYRAKLRINYLYDSNSLPNYVGEYTKQMSKVLDLLLESEYVMWPDYLIANVLPTYEGVANPYKCGKCRLTIDVDGTIRSCHPDYDTKIGSIYTHQFKDLRFPQKWSAENLPECQGCEWIMWCQGGCPYTRKLAYGTYDYRTPFCPAFKQLFPKLRQLKDKWKNGTNN